MRSVNVTVVCIVHATVTCVACAVPMCAVGVQVDLHSEQRAIVIDCWQGTHGRETAVVDGLGHLPGGVAALAIRRGQGDVTASGG